MASPGSLRAPIRFDPAFDPKRTEFLSRMVERWGEFEGVLTNGSGRNRCRYIGLTDWRMVPLPRPGSMVLVDAGVRRIKDVEWNTEFDRPMYFVEIRYGYRCGWSHHDGAHLIMQPHPLSRCLPQSWSCPGETEVVGLVTGVFSRLNGQ